MRLKKVIFTLIFIANLSIGGEIVCTSLELHAKVYPQLTIFSNSFSTQNSINIAIIYSSDSEYEAENYKNLLISNFGNRIKDKKLEIIVMNEEFAKNTKNEFQAAYIISNNPNIKNLLQTLTKRQILTFAANDNVMKNGALFGIKTGSKVDIILNKHTYQMGKYNLSNTLLRTVKVYDEN